MKYITWIQIPNMYLNTNTKPVGRAEKNKTSYSSILNIDHRNISIYEYDIWKSISVISYVKIQYITWIF